MLLFATASTSLTVGATRPTFVEIDGDVADGSGAGLPLDWADLFGADGSPLGAAQLLASSFVADHAKPDASYFAESDKDIEDVSAWKCAARNNPQSKTDILNAYAALFRADDGALLLHFGFERASNLGNSYMGFWLFQDAVSCDASAGGKAAFSGRHTPGDLLILSDFTNGGVVSSIRVYAWDPSAANNLRLLRDPAVCAESLDGPACGRVNAKPVATPWAPGNTKPLLTNTFFEGVVDVTRLVPVADAPCFGSFMAETRASQQLTAELKDFALGALSACGARLTLDPAQASGPVGSALHVDARLERDVGAGPRPVAGALVTARILDGPASFVDHVASCRTDAAGACRLLVSSPVAGASSIAASAQVALGGVESMVEATPASRTWFRLPPELSLATAPTVGVGDRAGADFAATGPLGPPTGSVTFSTCEAPCLGPGSVLGSRVLADGAAASPTVLAAERGALCFRADYAGDARYLPGSAVVCTTVVGPVSAISVGIADGSGGSRSHASADPGAVVSYVIAYRNDGDGVAHGVSIGSAVPAHATFLGCDGCDAPGTAPGTPLAWNLGNIPPAESREVSFRVRLDDTFPAGVTTIPRDAVVTTREEGSASSLPAMLDVAAAPSLALAKTARLLPSGVFAPSVAAEPGDTVEYRLALANTGNADAAGVRLSDTLPARTSFVSCTGSCRVADGSVSWDLATVPAGETRAVTLQVALDPVFPAGRTLVSNVAAFSSPHGSGSSPAAGVDVRASPASSLDKSVRLLPNGAPGASTDARPGDALEYTLSYRNLGNAPASGVVLLDVPPSRATVLDCGGCEIRGDALAWPLGVVAPGETRVVAFVVRLDSSFPAGTTEIPNVASAVTSEEGTSASNEAPVRVSAAPVSALTLDVRRLPDGARGVETSAAPGDSVEFALVYRNLGNAPAGDVALSLPLPARATPVSCAPACDAGPAWRLGTIPAGGSATVLLRARLDAVFPAGGTQLVARATGSTVEEGALASNAATVLVLAAPASSLDLAVRALPDGAFGPSATSAPGRSAEYRLTLRNDGNAPAGAVTVALPIPERAAFLSCTASCALNGGTARWSFGDVAPGTTRTALLSVTLDPAFPAGTTTLLATATGRSAEEPAFGAGPVRLDVLAAPASSVDLAVRALPDGAFGPAADAFPGSSVEYRLMYRNDGDAAAGDVRLVAALPARSTFAACDGCSVTDVVAWSLGSVPPGGSADRRFTVALDRSFPAGTTLLPTVAGASTSEEGAVPSNEVEVRVVAVPISSLALRIGIAPAADGTATDATPGDRVRYVLTYRNDGNAVASDAALGAPVPPRATLLACDGCERAGNALSWRLGSVGPGGTRSVAFDVVLDAVFPAGLTLLPTTAHAVTAEEGRVLSNEVAARVLAAPASTVSLALRAPADSGWVVQTTASPADLVVYRIVYSNDGNAPAGAVALTTTLPAGATLVECGGCAAAGPTLSWQLGTVQPGEPRIVSYSARLDGAFPAGTSDLRSRAASASAEEGAVLSNEVLVSVLAVADLRLAKTASAETVAPGGFVSYDLVFWNAGNGYVADASIEDTLPSGTAFVGCVPACVAANNVVRFVVGLAPAGGSEANPAGTVRLTVRVSAPESCVVCNVATLSGSGAAASPSNAACVTIGPDFRRAFAGGSATTVILQGIGPGNRLGAVGTRVEGVGEHADAAEIYAFNLAQLVLGRVGSTSSASLVSLDDAEARDLGISEVLDLNVLDGLVTAKKVRAVAEARADSFTADYDSTGSLLVDLVVDGQPIVDAKPGTRIALPAVAFGGGSYVALYERIGGIDAPEHPWDGVWRSSLTVNMIRIHLTDASPLDPGDQGLDIIVGQAVAVAQFPRTPSCELDPTPTVEAKSAGVRRTFTTSDDAPIEIGVAEIGRTGGHDDQSHLGSTSDFEIARVIDGAADGSLEPAASRASAFVQIEDVCLLPTEEGCTVYARAARTDVATVADAAGRASTGSVRFLKLVVAGRVIEENPAPNTVIDIPAVGFVVLNEQREYVGEEGRTGLLVRAIRLVVTAAGPGPSPGNEIVVGEARSAASFGVASTSAPPSSTSGATGANPSAGVAPAAPPQAPTVPSASSLNAARRN